VGASVGTVKGNAVGEKVEGEYEGPEGEYEGVHVRALTIMVLDGNAVGCKYVTDLYSNIRSIIINK
jgi:hypothetical protein